MKILEILDVSIPLVVDLDETLIRNDSLHEGIIRVLFNNPVSLLKVLSVLGRGRATIKKTIADLDGFDGADYLYRDDVIELVKRAKSHGRQVHLVTAADQSIADAVQAHLQCFDSVRGSDGKRNLKGGRKLRLLQALFPQGFIYAGDSASDLPIWNAARGAILVGRGVKHANRLRDSEIPCELLHDEPTSVVRDWIAELRIHQWAKNLLLVVPLIVGHLTGDIHAIAKTFCGFIAFGLIASSTYIINDLADIKSDRLHLTKRNRAIAAGRISVSSGLFVAVLLFVVGATSSFMLAPGFGVSVLVYVFLTLAYSFHLKRIPMLDVALIATLFTMRIVLGTVLLGLALSPWLLSFSAFLFLSLSLAKRHVELMRAKTLGRQEIPGRGYQVDDWPLTLGFGIAASLASIVVMLLFVTEQGRDTTGYSHPAWLFVAPICVLLWTLRVWLFSHRMELDDDPVVFALKDRVSFLLGAALLTAFILAL